MKCAILQARYLMEAAEILLETCEDDIAVTAAHVGAQACIGRAIQGIESVLKELKTVEDHRKGPDPSFASQAAP
jgi:hypothetical protein